MYSPPQLKHHEGSWMIVNKETGGVVTELFRGSKAIKHLNATKYKAIPIGEYLAGLAA